MALIKPVRGFTPKFGDDCWLAENAANEGICELDFSSVFFRGFVRFLRSYTCLITTWLRVEGNQAARHIASVLHDASRIFKGRFC